MGTTSEAMSTLHDIFLSYSREDERLVTQIYADLTKRGARVWLDRKRGEIGKRIEKEVFGNIAGSSSYAVAVTRNSLRSAWVAREFAFAKNLFEQDKIRIIPLFFEKFQLADYDFCKKSESHGSEKCSADLGPIGPAANSQCSRRSSGMAERRGL
jgi:hypothetical protein